MISNSRYLLLAKLGCKMDAKYPYYEPDMQSILLGIEKYKKELCVIDELTGETKLIGVLFYRNIRVYGDGTVEIETKKKSQPFASFQEYKSRLQNAMNALYDNAKDINRIFKYGIVTTISKGYDAPCCAVIAKNVGCDTALTFSAEGKYKDDSGVDIAKALGYSTIIERDADLYKKHEDYIEAYYCCNGEPGASTCLSAFDSDFSGNLVFTGDRGDSVWGAGCTNRNNEFHFIDMISHLGSSERRLWVGYISVPMPLYGASAWENIYEISNSHEMEGWRLNNTYDRPIPRRIIEEAGVDRGLFGIRKHGAGFFFHYDWAKRIARRMSEKSGASFTDYIRKNKSMRLKDFPLYFRYFTITWPIYYNAVAGKCGLRRVEKYDMEKASQTVNPMGERYLIPWAGTIMTEKYKALLKGGVN